MFGRSSASISPNRMPVKVLRSTSWMLRLIPSWDRFSWKSWTADLTSSSRLHGQDELGAFGYIRRGQQLARLVQVGRVLKRLRIEAGHELGDATDGALAVAPEDALDHLVVGECPAHRLPRLWGRQ